MSDTIYRQAAIDEIKDMYIAAEKWAYEAKDEETKARAESCMATNIEMKLRIEKLPAAQPEITQKDVEQYCHKRCLTVITNDLFHELSARFSAQPERKQVEIEYTAWNEELYGQSAICGNCGCTWQIGNNGEDNFCPNCGARMIRGGKDNDE